MMRISTDFCVVHTKGVLARHRFNLILAATLTLMILPSIQRLCKSTYPDTSPDVQFDIIMGKTIWNTACFPAV